MQWSRVARLLGTLSAVMLLAVFEAAACPICFSGRTVTLGQQLNSADEVVLALPSRTPVAVTGVAHGSQFRIVDVVKGSRVVYEPLPESVRLVDPSAMRSGKPLLLLRHKFALEWVGVGTIASEYADWLRQLMAISRHSELTNLDWRARVALLLPYLENPEPLAAEIAYGEFARAPYDALRSVKAQLLATKIASWLSDPKLASRRSTYTLLLGIVGTSDDAVQIEQRIDAALSLHDATNLAALLVADLELRGPSRVSWIETTYFADHGRTMPEIEAALLALSVHGGANATVPRQRVIEAYRFLMKERAAMAGFVAPQLADWAYWDATPEFVALLKAHALRDPALHFAVLTYLSRSPHPAAKAALVSLTEKSQ